MMTENSMPKADAKEPTTVIINPNVALNEAQAEINFLKNRVLILAQSNFDYAKKLEETDAQLRSMLQTAAGAASPPIGETEENEED